MAITGIGGTYSNIYENSNYERSADMYFTIQDPSSDDSDQDEIPKKKVRRKKTPLQKHYEKKKLMREQFEERLAEKKYLKEQLEEQVLKEEMREELLKRSILSKKQNTCRPWRRPF